MKRFYAILICFFLLSTSFFMGGQHNSNSLATRNDSDKSQEEFGVKNTVHKSWDSPGDITSYHYIIHPPIHIIGNDDFTQENGMVSGSGTKCDPYIIEGWDSQRHTYTDYI